MPDTVTGLNVPSPRKKLSVVEVIKSILVAANTEPVPPVITIGEVQLKLAVVTDMFIDPATARPVPLKTIGAITVTPPVVIAMSVADKTFPAPVMVIGAVTVAVAVVTTALTEPPTALPKPEIDKGDVALMFPVVTAIAVAAKTLPTPEMVIGAVAVAVAVVTEIFVADNTLAVPDITMGALTVTVAVVTVTLTDPPIALPRPVVVSGIEELILPVPKDVTALKFI